MGGMVVKIHTYLRLTCIAYIVAFDSFCSVTAICAAKLARISRGTRQMVVDCRTRVLIA